MLLINNYCIINSKKIECVYLTHYNYSSFDTTTQVIVLPSNVNHLKKVALNFSL